MKQIKEIYDGIKDNYLKRDDITGVFYGKKLVNGNPVDELCLSVHVKKKKPLSDLSKKDKIPKTIQNIKTDVVESNIRPMAITPYSGDVYKNTIMPGLSIGPECSLYSGGYKCGTIGLFVFDIEDPSIIGILSNHHVLADKKSSENPFIVQPGASTAYDNRIAELDINKIYLGDRGDMAFAPLNDFRNYDMNIYGTGIRVPSARDPQLDEVMTKVGRTTGVTSSKVYAFGSWTSDYTDSYSDGWYGNVTITGFVSAPLTDPYESISDHGDSGSLGYNSTTNEALGILTAGTLSGLRYTYWTYITNALNDFGLSIVPQQTSWSQGSTGDIAAIINPTWVLGNETVKFTLTLSPSFNMTNVCLFTDTEFIDSIDGGVVWAKRSSDSIYMAVGSKSMNPTCFLGDMEVGKSVSLDILVKNSNNLSLAGEYGIPLYIGQGYGISSSGILSNEYVS